MLRNSKEYLLSVGKTFISNSVVNEQLRIGEELCEYGPDVINDVSPNAESSPTLLVFATALDIKECSRDFSLSHSASLYRNFNCRKEVYLRA